MFTKIITFLAFLALVACDGIPSVRFVNALEGKTIDIYSGQLDTIHLAYEQVSGYQTLYGGEISVTNVVDSTSGNSYTNGEPLLISFDFNATVAIVASGSGVILALFNETFSGPIDTSKAYVRLIDLAPVSSKGFITLSETSGNVAAYVGPMVCTLYQPMDGSISSFRIYNSESGTYNNPDIVLPATLDAGTAYTVFYFTPSSGQAAEIVADRQLNGDLSAPPTTPVTGSATGIVQGLTSTSSDHSSASLVSVFGALIAFSAVFAL